MITAKKFLVSGRVQGVGFRWFVEEWANRLGLRGYVRNLHEGCVEAYAIGDADTLEIFKGHLQEGPRSAQVTGIEESEESVNAACNDFRIEGSW